MQIEDRKQTGVTIIAGFEEAFDATAAGRPTLARCTPYGVRAMESPLEQSGIKAMRYAKRCGYSAPWTANQLNRRGITRRGRLWTARSILWILKRYPDRKGTADDTGYLAELLDEIAEMKKNIENL
jgi:hypothetical protein